MSKKISTNLRANEQIRISPVRIIGANNEQLGVFDTFEALRMARESGMDLVEVAPSERPPVCRIMDYGKFKYHQKKNQKKSQEQQLKEVRMRPKTDDHDREVKINHAIKFLMKGDKVQFTMQFRGRERAHREIGTEKFQEVIQELGDLVKVERPPTMDGKNMILVVSPNKAAVDKLAATVKDGKVEDAIATRDGRVPKPAPANPAPPEPDEDEDEATA